VDESQSEPGLDTAKSVPSAATVDDLFVDRIRSGVLTPVQRRIARYIGDHGPQVAFLSSVELASRVGVSQPSVTRFATAVGFSGYGAMIEAVRDVVLTPRSRPPDTGAGLNRLQLAVEHSIESLTFLREQLADLSVLREAAATLAASKPMPVCGFRGSVPIASWFSFFASKIHPSVMALWGSDSHMVEKIAQARMAGATALLVIVMPRYPTQALLTVRAARAEGLKVILLVDSALSPLSPLADFVLPAPVDPDFVFDSQVAPLQMAAALLELIADHDGEGTQKRLDRLEELAADYEFFLSAGQ
jgi:DNA-binding MurR/RpiR family transcriptional regulator